MFSRVLLPVDPAGGDPAVTETGIALADAFGAELHVLSVIDRPQQRDQLRSDDESQARATVEQVSDPANARGLSTTADVTSGDPAESIIQTIGQSDIDLVVMGTRGRTGVERLILGSVAEEVVRESPMPVLTVPPDTE